MRFTIKVKHRVFQHYLWFAAGLFGLSLCAVIKFVPGWDDKLKFITTVAGGTLTFVYFVQKQKLEETRLFKELFTGFNTRYDSLNEELNRIRDESDSVDMKPTHRDVLYNYFNLCAEEHFFRSQGYIPEEVWGSWWKGMKYFFNCPRIRKVWDNDPGSSSYYGFVPPEPDSYTPAAGALPGGGAADQRAAA